MHAPNKNMTPFYACFFRVNETMRGRAVSFPPALNGAAPQWSPDRNQQLLPKSWRCFGKEFKSFEVTLATRETPIRAKSRQSRTKRVSCLVLRVDSLLPEDATTKADQDLKHFEKRATEQRLL